MSEDITKLLGSLLSNPDSLKNLMGSALATPPAIAEDVSTPKMNISNISNDSYDRRINLLTALKPYLSNTRAGNVDRAIQLIRLTKMTQSLRNEREQ